MSSTRSTRSEAIFMTIVMVPVVLALAILTSFQTAVYDMVLQRESYVLTIDDNGRFTAGPVDEVTNLFTQNAGMLFLSTGIVFFLMLAIFREPYTLSGWMITWGILVLPLGIPDLMKVVLWAIFTMVPILGHLMTRCQRSTAPQPV